MDDQRLFLLVLQTTQPFHTMPGWHCQRSPPQTHDWLPHWLPVLQRAFAALDVAPARDARPLAPRPLALEGAPHVALAGTERRRQRPQDASAHAAHASGKQQAPTENTLLCGQANTRQVSDLGPTSAGKPHDNQAAEAASMVSPSHATLDKDPGLPGAEPAGILTAQPQKSRQVGPGARVSSACILASPVHAWSSKTSWPGSNGVALSKMFYA